MNVNENQNPNVDSNQNANIDSTPNLHHSGSSVALFGHSSLSVLPSVVETSKNSQSGAINMNTAAKSYFSYSVVDDTQYSDSLAKLFQDFLSPAETLINDTVNSTLGSKLGPIHEEFDMMLLDRSGSEEQIRRGINGLQTFLYSSNIQENPDSNSETSDSALNVNQANQIKQVLEDLGKAQAALNSLQKRMAHSFAFIKHNTPSGQWRKADFSDFVEKIAVSMEKMNSSSKSTETNFKSQNFENNNPNTKSTDRKSTSNHPMSINSQFRGISLVRTLFPYVASTDRELSFPANAIVHLLEYSDPEWALGRFRGQIGYFPINFVSLLEPKQVSQILNHSLTFGTSPEPDTSRILLPDNVIPDSESHPSRANFSRSSRRQNELSFQAGDEIHLLDKDPNSPGWLYGKNNRTQQYGYFPKNYI